MGAAAGQHLRLQLLIHSIKACRNFKRRVAAAAAAAAAGLCLAQFVLVLAESMAVRAKNIHCQSGGWAQHYKGANPASAMQHAHL
jgi:hypothetical protein